MTIIPSTLPILILLLNNKMIPENEVLSIYCSGGQTLLEPVWYIDTNKRE